MNKDLILEIDNALDNIPMPQEIRELLLKLRPEMLDAKSAEEKFAVFVKWGGIVLRAVDIGVKISEYF